MKALVLKQNGGPENFKMEDIAIPGIGEDEVLIKVKAISINPVDTFVRQYEQVMKGILQPDENDDKFIIGWDISGTVEKTGTFVKKFQEGDDVFGMVNFPGNGKGYAEYVAAPLAHLSLKPGNISHEEAAAATLAALTAWQALVTHTGVQKGDKVLVHAAGGGVGHYAVQIAKYLGAYVIGTASAAKKDFVLSLGADEYIDYTTERFEHKVNDADMVLDSIPGDHLLRSMDAVKSGGKVISIKGSFEGNIAEKAKEKGLFTHRMMVNSNGGDMKQLAQLLEKGYIRSHVSKKYDFHEMAQAHKDIERGKTQGKIVLVVS